MDKDSLTLPLARGLSVEKIAQRSGKPPSTVSHWMAKYELQAPNHDTHRQSRALQFHHIDRAQKCSRSARTR